MGYDDDSQTNQLVENIDDENQQKEKKKMNKDFEGKYAVVTGAASGMGAATAKMMARRGLAGVMIVDKNEEGARATAADCEAAGCKAYVSVCDIVYPEQIAKTTEDAKSVFPHIDILVNAAGYSPYDQPWDVESVEHFDMLMNTNFRSQYLFCQAFLPGMVEREYGYIVNYASCVARAGSGLSISYSASKGAIMAATRSLAKAVSPSNVHVNAVLPGVIKTPMLRGDYSEQAKAWPLRRCGEADEVAEMTCFLASDRASYMTGACIDVNGGYVFG